MGFLLNIVRDSRRTPAASASIAAVEGARTPAPGFFTETAPGAIPAARAPAVFSEGAGHVAQVEAQVAHGGAASVLPAISQKAAAEGAQSGGPVNIDTGFREERAGAVETAGQHPRFTGPGSRQLVGPSPAEHTGAAELPGLMRKTADSVTQEQVRTALGDSPGKVVASHGGSSVATPETGSDRSAARGSSADQESSTVARAAETRERQRGATTPPELVADGTADAIGQVVVAGGPSAPHDIGPTVIQRDAPRAMLRPAEPDRDRPGSSLQLLRERAGLVHAGERPSAQPPEPRVQIGTIEVVVISPAAVAPAPRTEFPAPDIASRLYLRNI